MTEDDAGDSYDMVFTGININRKWKSDKQWFGEYINTYAGATLGGATDDQAHAAARAAADTGRWLPDSQEFKDAFKEVTSDSNLSTGSKFVDNSKIYHADANYNFTHLWDWAQVQAGGSYRTYELNSSGTIYTDDDGPIDYSEYGVYTQIQKNLLAEDRLKITASLRYDKSELFDGFFSPRLSLAYTAGAMKEHNIRASVQTGFRNPTTQDLFIGLDAGRAVLVGSAEDNLDRDVRTYSVSQNAQNAGIPATVEVVGRAAYENAFSISSVQSGAPAAADIEIVKPEEVTSYEIGYRGKAGNFIIDLLGYHNKYKDFISGENVLVPFYGVVGDNSLSLFALQNGDYKAYSTYTNSDADVKSYGASIGVSTRVFGNYDLQANYTYAKEDFDKENNPDFRTNFNTPEHRLKATFGNANVYENFGFNVAWRWSDDFFWEATFGDGPVESYHTFDAQVSYRMENFLNSMVKVGAANLFADEYTTAFGTGYVGAQYYVSWVINNF
jgi:outer membrane receptor for ferrienterochelin and colicin